MAGDGLPRSAGPIFWLVGLASLGAAVGAFLATALYAFLSHYVHPRIHMRTGAGYEKTWLFQYLLKRPIWHHYRIDTNYNIVLPLGDGIFRSGHHRIRKGRKDELAAMASVRSVERT